MSSTVITSQQIKDGVVQRSDLNVTTSGQSVVAKILQGNLITLGSTGADGGTGDVTINHAVSGVISGSYGSSSAIPIITVDSYGHITAISTSSVNIVSSLAGLSDVTLTSPTANQVLQYNGTKWVNGAAPATYTLPPATTSILGGIIVGSGLAITSGGVLSATGGGGNVGAFRTTQNYTATSGQTTFTVSNGYTPGYLDVFVNGVYLTPSNYTATNGSTFILSTGAAANDIVSVFAYYPFSLTGSSSRTVTSFTATSGQTTFSISYVPGQIDVFYNGARLSSTEYTATDGATVVLNTAATLNAIVEVIMYLAGGGVANSSIVATAPLNYSAGNYTFSISQATTSTNGYLSSSDWNKFNSMLPLTGGTVTGVLTLSNSTAYSSLQINGYANRGGTGYHDFLSATNTYGSATTPSKFFRLDSSGNLQIINSGYTATIFQLTDGGNLDVPGAVSPHKWIAGQVIQVKTLSASDVSFSTNVTVSGTTYTQIASVSYTPLSTSSYIFFEVYCRYEIAGAAADDWYSQLTWAGNEIGYSHQTWTNGAGGGTRSGVLFPIAGRVTNSSITGYTFAVNAKRGSSDDNGVFYADGAFWIKIIEVAR